MHLCVERGVFVCVHTSLVWVVWMMWLDLLCDTQLLTGNAWERECVNK